ncbi:hypothetical protein [Spirosoma areae]
MKALYNYLIATFLLGAGIQANAQPIVARWDFENPASSGMNPSTAVTTSATGIIASNVIAVGVVNAGVTNPGSNGSGPDYTNYGFSANGWPTQPAMGTGSLDPGKYYEYTITAQPGCTINVAAFQINYRGDNDQPGENSSGFYEVRSSYDMYATSLNRGAFGPVTSFDGNFNGGTFTATTNPTQLGTTMMPLIETTRSFRVYYYNLPSATSVVRMDIVRIGAYISCPMPVEFTSFEGKASVNRVQLSWATSWERNADRFEVERSQNATEFGAIGQVRAAGDATAKQAYGFTDEQALTGVNYYRLRQVDRDGSVQYSKIIAVTTRPEAPAIAVLGNPTEGGRINLQLFNLEAAKLQITDMQGRSVAFRMTESAGGLVTLEPASPLSSGMYLVGAAKVPAIKIVVQ